MAGGMGQAPFPFAVRLGAGGAWMGSGAEGLGGGGDLSPYSLFQVCV